MKKISTQERLKEAEILLQRMKDAGVISNKKRRPNKTSAKPKTPKIQITIEDGEITITRSFKGSKKSKTTKIPASQTAYQYAYIDHYFDYGSNNYAYGAIPYAWSSYAYGYIDPYESVYYDLGLQYNYETNTYHLYDYLSSAYTYDNLNFYAYGSYLSYQDGYGVYDAYQVNARQDQVINTEEDITIRILTSGEIVIKKNASHRPRKNKRKK